jgi:hypothetical protein
VTEQVFLERDKLEDDMSAFCVKHGYNMLLAMTISFTDKQPFRQLAIFSHSALCREEVGTTDKCFYLFLLGVFTVTTRPFPD